MARAGSMLWCVESVGRPGGCCNLRSSWPFGKGWLGRAVAPTLATPPQASRLGVPTALVWALLAATQSAASVPSFCYDGPTSTQEKLLQLAVHAPWPSQAKHATPPTTTNVDPKRRARNPAGNVAHNIGARCRHTIRPISREGSVRTSDGALETTNRAIARAHSRSRCGD